MFDEQTEALAADAGLRVAHAGPDGGGREAIDGQVTAARDTAA
jgi:hypothetical protein